MIISRHCNHLATLCRRYSSYPYKPRWMWCKLSDLVFHSKPRQMSTFSDLELDPRLVDRLREADIVAPTSIQSACVPLIYDGVNVVVNSETGSGKTLSYALPVIQRMVEESQRVGAGKVPLSALFVVPTFELAHQVHAICNYLLAPFSLRAALVLQNTALTLSPGTSLVVCTPAGIRNYKAARFASARTLVFDEADKLLPANFKRTNQFYWLLDYFTAGRSSAVYKRTEHEQYPPMFNKIGPKKADKVVPADDRETQPRQFVFVGATLTEHGARSSLPAIKKWCPALHVLRSDVSHRVLLSTEVDFVQVQIANKFKQLVQCVLEQQAQLGDEKGGGVKLLVFVNSTKAVKDLHKVATTSPWNSADLAASLECSSDVEVEDANTGYTLANMKRFYAHWRERVVALHGEVSLPDRLRVLNACRESNSWILISTDSIARGIDIPGISAVVQYDFPTSVVTFLHRAGRTSRMGAQGKLINFVVDVNDPVLAVMRESIEQNVSLERIFNLRMSDEEVRADRVDDSWRGDAAQSIDKHSSRIN